MRIFIISLSIFLAISCNTTKSSIKVYQTNSYNGIKKVDEFFIKDSLLYFFSNRDMGGCLIDILKFNNINKDTAYYKVEKKDYSLLCFKRLSKISQDTILFSFQEFCRYNSFFYDELVVNNKPYKLIDNKIKILKSDILSNEIGNVIEIKFINLGTYSQNIKISDKDSLVNIFFHKQTSLLTRVKNNEFKMIKIISKGKDKIMIMGNDSYTFSKIKTSYSNFSEFLF